MSRSLVCGGAIPQMMPGVYALPQVLSSAQIGQILAMQDARSHHDDDGHVRQDKPLRLPWVASSIMAGFGRACLDGIRPCGVDENMKLYRLQPDKGAVPRHIDRDFTGPDRSVALYSVLLYLNDGFVGGETVFHGAVLAPRVAVGGGLVFKHDIFHEGLAVRSGEKYVLKTDLFFQAP